MGFYCRFLRRAGLEVILELGKGEIAYRTLGSCHVGSIKPLFDV